MDTGYEAPVQGVTGAMCAECKAIKPAAEFKRWLSMAQARARGYSGTRRVQIDSSLCKDCQPKRKREAELTIKELQYRIFNGEIHPTIGKDKIDRRRKTISVQRATTMRKRWAKERSALWFPIRQHLEEEVRRVTHQRKHIKDNAAKDLLHTFFGTYLEALRTIRGRIDNLELTLDQSPEHGSWESYALAEELRSLEDEWQAVPLDHRMALRRHPSLVTWRTHSSHFAKPPPSKPVRSHRALEIAELPAERRARELEENWWADHAPDAPVTP